MGPASVLFEKPFFEKIYRALKPGGVLTTQGECIWLHAELIKDVLEMCKGIFVGGSVQYGYCSIPTYPSGQIGFVMCSKPTAEGKTVDFSKPVRPPPVAPGKPPRVCSSGAEVRFDALGFPGGFPARFVPSVAHTRPSARMARCII